MRERACLALFGLLLAAAPAAAQEKEQLADQARTVLRQYCSRCHNGDGSQGGNFDLTKHADLLNKEIAVAQLVVPKDVKNSLVMKRLASDKSPMPPKNVAERPSEQDKKILEKWIEAGAPPFPDKVKNPFVPINNVLEAILADLRLKDKKDRPYFRYFTLHNLHNGGVGAADVRLAQAALSKALNSLCWQADLVLPRQVKVAVPNKGTDPGLLFAIDLRDLGWNEDTWLGILAEYPYGLKYHNHSDKQLQNLNKDIEAEAGYPLVHVRADWFVSTATRPPLYYWLLDIPEKASELEKRLGVDVAKDFANPTGQMWRAGFGKSGVSKQNRMVERHKAKYGAYWKSYDFKPNSARAKLTRFPLGPLKLFDEDGKQVKNPYAKQAFAHDGGEIIFNLPNGLQGYALIKGDDTRIDEGPIDVVSDATETGGTPAIVNGVACMYCHKHGVIDFTDTIRKGTSLRGKLLDKVEELYPEKKDFDVEIAKDRKKFLRALEDVAGKYLRVGADKDRPLIDFEEPVGVVARRYRNEYLDLAAILVELDLETADGLKGVDLSDFGLEALADKKRKAFIPRGEWEAKEDGVSLMQAVARKLRATPVGPQRPIKWKQ